MREEFVLSGETIDLHCLLKAVGLCATGGEAKHVIASGLVCVEGQVERRKACKIRAGQSVSFEGHAIVVRGA